MYKLCVFAGTTEGREIIEYLCTQPVSVTACVATEYGETLLPSCEKLTVSAKRLSKEEMVYLFRTSQFNLVIDATHPYAAAVTECISTACRETGTEYLRLLRGASANCNDGVYVPDAEHAADFLRATEGNILLTTGSKDLKQFTTIPGFADRVYARVLPLNASLEACSAVGLKASHILAVQGPFREEMNVAMLRFVDARWMVTKDGGTAGGFQEKASAARKTGVRLVVIGRPPQREGLSFSETVDRLCESYGCTRKPLVQIVGIGPGGREAMTTEVRQAIGQADCLIGAGRMLEAVSRSGQPICEAIAPEAIAEFILSNPRYHRFAVVMSGDTGFFSGTKKLLPLLQECETKVLPGISSLSYLCAKLGTSYEDVLVRSLHGRQHDIIPDIHANRRVFVLTGGADGVQKLARNLSDAGLGHVRMAVGVRLSYPEEEIITGTAEELALRNYEALSAVLLENDTPNAVVTHGLPDTAFQRGEGADGVVPMTKSEVRSVCLSKLRLTEYAVCWDVGAGTGSVSVEMALQARKGSVYAVERKAEAVALLRQNKIRFGTENLTVVSGSAPDVCLDLPAPTHVFVGGSSGNLRQILRQAMEKNPNVRIVATAITLESVAELTDCIKELPLLETEVISMQIARDRKAGPYHLMTGQNPVYIFTLQAGGSET